MASSNDYKKLWEKYQAEGVPNGISIVKFCQMNGILYNVFQKWYQKMVEQEGGMQRIEVVGQPKQEAEDAKPVQRPKARVSSVDIIFGNGLRISHRDLEYGQLKVLVEKLEVLC